MRWRTGRRSSNIEDRRGTSASGGFRFPGGLGGGMRFPRGGMRMPGGLPMGRGRRMGCLSILLIIGAVVFLGVDPGVFLGGLQTGPVPGGYQMPQTAPQQRSGARDQLADFVSVVLADTEDTWHRLFDDMGRHYSDPILVLFRGSVDSACGYAQAAVGPFYCPADQKVYIDLSFYDDLRTRHGAPGDFAQAYVIAHEVGHHVQNLLGISSQVQAARQRASESDANALSVRLELQADCFAGLWANRAHTRGILEVGDVDEALTAASAIGDDRLQRQSHGYVTPDSFTHGSSAQRVRWFRTGLESGDIRACNTFEAERM